jgi:hypothetical protein
VRFYGVVDSLLEEAVELSCDARTPSGPYGVRHAASESSLSYGVAVTWLPRGFNHPERVELPTGHHLRPVREADVDIDYPAVMGSRQRLWAKYGTAWGWPPVGMTYEADRKDLARHEREIADQETFNYAVLNEHETELLGCVYIDPADEKSPPGSDAVASWWLVDQAVGTDLEGTLDDFLPRWLTETWGFGSVHYFP